MASYTYSRAPEKDLSNLEDENDRSDPYRSPRGRRHDKRDIAFFSISILGLLSLCLNAYTFYQYYFEPERLCNDVPSRYAGLRRTQEKDIMPDMDFTSHNRSIQDAAWESGRMNSWRLFVALDDSYSGSKGLPHSMRWPWNLEKGVYVLNAAHELHCVKVIRSFVVEKNDGVPDEDLVWGYGHAMHCLNELRESVMCNADDTPLYTGRLNANVHADEVVNGRGTMRMCRNWDALMEWADARSACYLSEDKNRKDENFSELDRYKHCPHGERPWEDL